jgi:hypothetical protein
LELAEGAQFVAADWMSSRLAIFGAAHMQGGGAVKFDLGPFQVAQLDRPQSVPVRHEDQGRITMPVAPFARGPHKRFDL